MKLWLLTAKEIVREFGKDIYTLLYTKWKTNKDLLCSTCNSTQAYVSAWMGEGYTYICMAESLHCSPETITVLLISYTPIQNKKFKIGGRKEMVMSDVPFRGRARSAVQT